MRPVEFVSQVLNRFYRVDSHRRKKQLMFVLLIVGVVISWVYYLYIMLCFILTISKWTLFLVLILVYSFIFIKLLTERLAFLYRTSWISLEPFNLYTDVRDGIIWVINSIRIKFLQLRAWYNTKVYTPVKTKVLGWIRFITHWVKKIANFIIGKVKQATKVFVDKIAVPFYL